MKILKRSNLIYNEVLFVIFSIVYLHISFSLDADISAIDLPRLINMLKGLPLLIGLSTLCIGALLLVRRFSIYLLSFLTLIVFYKSFSLFLLSYDKLLLVLNVVYMLVSYNMILLLKEELSLAIYQPGFKENSLEVENYKNLTAHLSFDGNNISGNITNLDKLGLVVKIDTNTQIRGVVDINIPFEGEEFYSKGVVATRFTDGYGIKILASKKTPSVLQWKDLYNIFYRRGYKI
jgi:hypothetical protein